MAFSTKSYFSVDTSNTSKNYAKATDHSSYKYYNNMTWSMWGAWYPATNKNIWSMWDANGVSKRSWLFSVQSDGTFRIILSWDGVNFSLHKTANVIFDGSWKHIIVTFASGTFTCKVNDVSQTLNQTIAWGGGAVALYSANIPHMIGSEDAGTPAADKTAPGCYSNYSLWSKVLSASEITELYNNGCPKDLTAHSAYANATNWIRMDQSDSGSTLVDSINSGANLTITKSGTTQWFNQSNLYATYSLDPGIANVKTGTAYITDGDNKTGTYDGSDRWSDPGESNVRSGTAYKANSTSNNKTGTCAVPTAANTKTGVATDNTTGTYDGSDRWTDPGEANVRNGTAYKANSTTNNKTGSASIPTAANVRSGTATDATTGTLAVPAAGDVRSGVSVDNTTGTLVVPSLANTKIGVAGDGGTGTYTGSDRWSDPGESNVADGVAYKANSTTNNKLGTLEAITIQEPIDYEIEEDVTMYVEEAG